VDFGPIHSHHKQQRQAATAHIITLSGTVVIGVSFIGLEVAASLRARNVHVDVGAPSRIPMERIMRREIGTVIRRLHEEHGVQFHLPGKVRSLSGH
jgi:NAD(P)H-nitrite reductase large subunit